MAFGSNSFPLGPNGQFPRQRVGVFNNMIAPPNRVEDVYRGNGSVRLPVVEKEYVTTVERAKQRMKKGRIMRQGQRADKFRPKTMVNGLGATRDWRSLFGKLLRSQTKPVPAKQIEKEVARSVVSNAVTYKAPETVVSKPIVVSKPAAVPVSPAIRSTEQAPVVRSKYNPYVGW